MEGLRSAREVQRERPLRSAALAIMHSGGLRAVVAVAAVAVAAVVVACSAESADGGRQSSAAQGSEDASSLVAHPDAGAAQTMNPASESGDTCWLEYLGDWVRCELSGEAPYAVEVEAESAQDCVDACLSDAECVAVTDFFWRGGETIGCFLMIDGGCDEPMAGAWTEGDGAKEYRKVCGQERPANGITELDGPRVVGPGCTFEALQVGQGCDGAAEEDAELVGADSLDECFELCAAREDCSAVIDWIESFDNPREFECVLHLAACDAVVDIPIDDPADSVYYFRKECATP